MNMFSEKKDEEDQEKTYTSQWKMVLNFVLELVKIVVISLAIIIPIRAYVAQPFYVEGASMEPNFFDKEYLIVDEISYRFNEPERGDVVILRPPNNYTVYYIKRIIGLPGETVEITNNQLKIYNAQNPEGFILDESKYLNEENFTTLEEKKYPALSNDEYFVLGDNRQNSMDSRRFGTIRRSNIKGQVFLRALPFNRFTIFFNEKAY